MEVNSWFNCRKKILHGSQNRFFTLKLIVESILSKNMIRSNGLNITLLATAVKINEYNINENELII